ncbi:MAG: Zn-ribbon domain-containing OB-fold protein [bacterium]
MTSWMDETEDHVHRGRIKVPYTWWVGETGSRFFAALRDDKKILGTCCTRCRMVFVPPRKDCGRCFSRSLEWRELGRQGTLTTYTTPRYQEPLHPMPPPFAFGIIRLDGADTGLTHLVGEFRQGELEAGLRVEAVFRDDRQGNILDIRYFRPVR